MCTYKGVRVSRDQLIDQLQQERELKMEALNAGVVKGYDFKMWPIIKSSKDCGWELVHMEWGFIPDFIKTREEAAVMRAGYTDETGRWQKGKAYLNARNDELLKSKVWRHAALNHRCLFLSTGFFEYRHVPVIGKSG